MLAGNVALLRADEQPKWYTDAVARHTRKGKKTTTTNDALRRMWNLKEDRKEYFEFVALFVLQIRR